MLFRIFCIFSLSILFACGPQENSEAPATSGTSGRDTLKSIISNPADTSFTRLNSSIGQKIYVPVYSHIYQQDHKKTFNLTATLSFRNADLNRTLLLTKVLYYDSAGILVRNYLEQPKEIKPLASTSFVVEENDLRGGVGANFIITWESSSPVFPPVVEAVMISTTQQQGISFVSGGRILENINSAQATNN